MARTGIVLAATLTLGAGALAISAPLGTGSASALNGGAPGPQASQDVIPGSYIVVYKDSVDQVGRATSARENELGFDRGLVYSHALKGFSAELTPAQVSELRADPKVDFVSPNRRVEAAASEPLAAGEETPPTGARRILASTTTTVRQAGANVAVIDTGIQLDHPDLNVVGGTDCIDPGTPPDDLTGENHGTHVAGIIGAKNNGIGLTGVAPNTKIYAVRVLGGSGGTWATVICGIDWVTANHASDGIEVANMSLGDINAPADPTQPCDTSTDALRLAICASTEAGVRYVVAAMNSSRAFDSSTPITVPAAYPEVLTVTAVADTDGTGGGAGPATCFSVDDTPASFSNWASTAAGAAHTIAAPGVCIKSTWGGSSYSVDSGTSMASPHVAAAVALCVEEAGVPGPCSGETPAQTIAHMRESARALTALRPSFGFVGDPDHSPVPDRYYGYLVHGPDVLNRIEVTNTNDDGPGSLRAAIGAANADPDSNEIFFEPGLSGSIVLQSELPALAEDVAIDGPGADRLSVERSSSAADPFGIFAIASGVTAEISGLTVAHADTGVYSLFGTLTLREVEVRDNNFGGVVNDSGNLTVLHSTVADNDWTTDNGAAGILNASGTMAVHDSTIAGNEVHAGAGAQSAGGVVTLGGTTTITNSTIAGNINPAGAANLSGGATTLKSTIVANPLGGGPNCGAAVTSQGFNLESSDTCDIAQATDLTDANPLLGALGDNGGTTRTLLPSTSSAAVDGGHAGSEITDQIGERRTLDLPSATNAAGGDGTDIGAVELRPPLQVTNTDDTGAGSLRAAITSANGLIGHDSITFALGLTGTVNLQSALPSLTGSVEIDGPGLEQLTVRRDIGGNYGVFSVSFGADAEISGLTITNGAATNGGGVFNGGRLLLDGVLVSSNSATNRGGGVYNQGSLTVKASTLAGNTAVAGGGGLQAVGGRQTVVLDSAISGNQSNNGGAGIDDSRGSLEMHTSTVSGNTVSAGVASAAGGVLIISDKTEWNSVGVPPDAPAEIVDSTIAGNTHLGSGIANLTDKGVTPAAEIPSIVKSTIVANPLGGGPNCDGAVSSAGFNLESADTCGFSAPSDRTSQNPQLGPLADNGGPTRTMALPLASPAVDGGASTSGPSDQRGLVRPVDQAGTPNAPGGNASDIGAFELEAQPSASVPQPPAQPVQPAPSKKCKKGQKLKKGKCVKKKKRR